MTVIDSFKNNYLLKIGYVICDLEGKIDAPSQKLVKPCGVDYYLGQFVYCKLLKYQKCYANSKKPEKKNDRELGKSEKYSATNSCRK